MWIRVGRLANNPMAPVDWQNTVKIPNRRGGFTVFEATPGRGKVNLEAIFVVTDTVNIPPRLNLPGAFRTFMPQMRYIIARSLRTAMKRAARRAARRLG